MSSKLTKIQKTALGKYQNSFSSEFLEYHENVSHDYIEPENELQSVEEFEKMGLHKPNAEGTGRNLITSSRKKIYLMKLGNKIIVDFANLSEIMLAYFGMEILILKSPLKLGVIDKTISIIDAKKKISFPLKHIKNTRIDVFSMFDVLVEYVPKDCYSLVTVTDYEIYDPEIPKNFIYGRACGDRVAVIHDLGIFFNY